MMVRVIGQPERQTLNEANEAVVARQDGQVSHELVWVVAQYTWSLPVGHAALPSSGQ